MSETTCTWTSGNEPCATCPRVVTALHMCKLLLDTHLRTELPYLPPKEGNDATPRQTD